MLRQTLFALCLLLTAGSVYGKAVFNIKKDFHATGNGHKDDTQAFLNAVKKINELKGNAVLIIPAGTYIITPQHKADGKQLLLPAALDILSFEGCTDFAIQGSRGARIRFADRLYYGSFKPDSTGRIKSLAYKTTDYQYRVAIGHGVRLKNCSKINISDLELDGNNGRMILGNEFGDTGYQIDNDGLFIENTSELTVSDCYIHHFGRDGIQILNQTPQVWNTPSQQLQLIRCRFEHNARQGLSWTGGAGLTATGCTFSYTARTSFSSAPRAGVDFEPNSGLILKDGLFRDCTFAGNAGVGIIADEGGPYSHDVRFVNCRVVSGDAAALWIKGMKFRFSGCTIQGSFLFGARAQSREDGTYFTNCHFTDSGAYYRDFKYLIESSGAKYMVFDSCDFKAAKTGLVYMSPGNVQPAEKTLFRNCRIKMNMVPDSADVRSNHSSNTIFEGATDFISSTASLKWDMGNSIISHDSSTRGAVAIKKKCSLSTYDTLIVGDDKGDATLTIEEGGALTIYPGGALAIKIGSSVVVSKGGMLCIGLEASLLIAGRLIAGEGALICLDEAAKADKTSIGNIYIRGRMNDLTMEALKKRFNNCKTDSNE